MRSSAPPPPGEPLTPRQSPADQLPATREFRSTWLVSSLNAVRDRGLLDAYLGALPGELYEPMITMVAGAWVPIDLAVAHYRACDALALTPREQTDIGRGVTQRLNQTLLSTAVRLAATAGATPWTPLTHLPRLWERMFVGGGTAVYKLGPKESRIDMVAGPLASIPYFRNGLRGVLLGIGELFSRKVYVSEVARHCTQSIVVYRAAWV